MNAKLTRRDAVVLLSSSVGLVAGGGLALGGKQVLPQRLVYGFGPNETATLEPTAACADAHLTARYEEGPFYTPNTPLKTDFRLPDHGGHELLLEGKVTDERCVPIAGAVLDFWHADPRADYDNVDYAYRGHMFTGADGSYALRTIVPPPYRFALLWRVPHIHVKVQGPTTRLLTTQIFFPDASGVTRDVDFDRSLLARVAEPVDGVARATFHFVLRRS
ncbi:MAG: hypothetical protein JNK82_45920 [Myxococcaceae bacterium]|nr:hypothetical protein [Myxococcaceae bacterium]